jgi:hypothetical protein
LSGEDVGKLVLVKGSVSDLFEGNSFNSFRLCAGVCVKIIDFKKMPGVKQGRWVAVEGTVKEYNGDLEVDADSIEVLSNG